MASVKISELNSIVVITSDDFFPLVDSGSGTTYRADFTTFNNWCKVYGSASHANYSDTASFSTSASYAKSASYARMATSSSNALTASYFDTSGIQVTFPATSAFALTASLAYTASWAYTASVATSASYALSASSVISASYARSSSFVLSSSYALSASYANTSSYAVNAQHAAVADSLSSNVSITMPPIVRGLIMEPSTMWNDFGVKTTFNCQVSASFVTLTDVNGASTFVNNVKVLLNRMTTGPGGITLPFPVPNQYGQGAYVGWTDIYIIANASKSSISVVGHMVGTNNAPGSSNYFTDVLPYLDPSWVYAVCVGSCYNINNDWLVWTQFNGIRDMLAAKFSLNGLVTKIDNGTTSTSPVNIILQVPNLGRIWKDINYNFEIFRDPVFLNPGSTTYQNFLSSNLMSVGEFWDGPSLFTEDANGNNCPGFYFTQQLSGGNWPNKLLVRYTHHDHMRHFDSYGRIINIENYYPMLRMRMFALE